MARTSCRSGSLSRAAIIESTRCGAFTRSLASCCRSWSYGSFDRSGAANVRSNAKYRSKSLPTHLAAAPLLLK
eukprot:7293699-Lingulodinium_polyedra.AAC.1